MKRREIWIINTLLVTQDDRRRVFYGCLRIQDGVITEVLKKTPKKLPKSAQMIDAAGLTVLPGFVQAHVHLCQTLFRNQADDMELLDWLSKRIWVMEAAHTDETLYASALLGIHELLSSGTTCILDMGTVRYTPAIIQAVIDSGIRASVGKCLMDHPKTTPESLRESTASALSEAQSLFKEWNGTEEDRIRISYAPRFVISCTERLLAEVSKLSLEQNAVVHTHASENKKEIAWVRKMVGQDNVQYLHRLGLTSPRTVLAHCVWLKKNEMVLLKKTGTHIAHCPSSNLKLASGIAPIPQLRAQGINVALGADGAPCNNNLNMFTEMRLAALLHKPGGGPKTLPATEVLDMATRNGAQALGWQDKIGSIEIGKRADLIALNLYRPENSIPGGPRSSISSLSSKVPSLDAIASSIVYSSQSQHLSWSLVDGRLVTLNGRVLEIPHQKLMSLVWRAQAVIRRKCPSSFLKP